MSTPTDPMREALAKYRFNSVHAIGAKAQEAEDAKLIAALAAAPAQPAEPVAPNLIKLAHRTLWIAYCWNDHNFDKPAHKYAQETAAECGIKSFEDANDWIATPPAAQPLTDEQIDEACKTVPAAIYALMHGGYESTVAQFRNALRDVARAVLAAAQEPKP